MTLTQSCSTLPGVGPALTNKLALCGIHTIQDLLFHLPYRYQDRTRITPMKDLRHQDWAVVIGHIRKTEIIFSKRRILQCYIEDKTGIVRLRFFHFNQKQASMLQVGTQIRAFGEIRQFDTSLDMIHPEYQVFEEGVFCTVEETLTPIYNTTQGLTQQRIRQLVKIALEKHQHHLQTLEWLTPDHLQTYHFQSLAQAIYSLHYPAPDSSAQFLETGDHPGLKRLAFEELMAQQLSMFFARQQRALLVAPPMSRNNTLAEQFLSLLPFRLTQAQTRVYLDIQQDFLQTKPMLRLVQGDVGSGKTVIAALAAIQAIANGYQVALMAPTDILSEQHAQTLTRWCEPLGIQIYRLSAKMKARDRKATLEALSQHQCQLIIGTHALFQESVIFARLGLIIIDEQHRFGVQQRLQLQQKGQTDDWHPHQLLMTATPIPRTLAMTQLAHLDISIIDELPPGRTPITTVVLHQDKRELIIERLRSALANGRQVYWVCTLIEESEKLQCQAATHTATLLQTLLPEVRVGLLHGRLNLAEKEHIMASFKSGDIHLLVATTVIEVGVDVPNASLMIIENAERLGLSQLHQLRGRVGRGTAQSHCLLLYQPPLSQMSKERLQVMRDTNDGFIIAEKDLTLRGSGDILGNRQTGYRTFKIADLHRDRPLLQWLKPTVQRLMADNPETAHAIARQWLGEFEALIIT